MLDQPASLDQSAIGAASSDASLNGAPHQRAKGRAHIVLKNREGQTVLDDLHQSGSLKLFLPKNHASRMDGVVVNTAGGIAGGDRLEVSANLENDCDFCMTSQTAERVYKCLDQPGRVESRFSLGENASLDWLPQETILFDGCRLERCLDVSMPKSATLTLLESVVLGRKAMGETVKTCHFSDRWNIVRDDRLVFADYLKFASPAKLGGCATFGGIGAFATLVHIAPNAELRLNEMRSLLTFDAVRAAASAWNGLMVVRFASSDGFHLRNALTHILKNFRNHPLPAVWQ